MSTVKLLEKQSFRVIQRTYGVSYYWATRFLPKDLRQATETFYAFVRIPDEIVDTDAHHNVHDAGRALRDWRTAWNSAQRQQIGHPVLDQTVTLFRRYGIPFAYADSFLDAMEQDLTQDQYATYKDLKAYMYGSAAIVGLVMTHIVGYTSERAFAHATALGEAMQLTNFLRDIGEDFRDRKRIYIPEEDLAKYPGVAGSIRQFAVTAPFCELMRFEIARTRALYAEAQQGITYLRSWRGRFAVRVALNLYRGILDEIERNGYDVFTRRARTSTWRKLWLVITALGR